MCLLQIKSLLQIFKKFNRCSNFYTRLPFNFQLNKVQTLHVTVEISNQSCTYNSKSNLLKRLVNNTPVNDT